VDYFCKGFIEQVNCVMQPQKIVLCNLIKLCHATSENYVTQPLTIDVTNSLSCKSKCYLNATYNANSNAIWMIPVMQISYLFSYLLSYQNCFAYYCLLMIGQNDGNKMICLCL
jgi:hypothetical protein